MKIELSSAEFDLNTNLMHTLFGGPKYNSIYEMYKNAPMIEKNAIVLKLDDIDKLNTWASYKSEIKSLWNEDAILKKDVNNQYWVCVPGTGYCFLYSTDLGKFKV